MIKFSVCRYTCIRWLPCVVAFAWGMLMLVPPALSQPQHGDEAQYGWGAGYFTARLAHLDFTQGGTRFADPGWNPLTYWNNTQPMTVRFLYGSVILLAHLPMPERPYNYDPLDAAPETLLPSLTLYVLRVVAIVCAALAAALFAWRFGWPGTIALCAFFVIPHVQSDMARAWAEGPLLLSYALCAVAWRSRWVVPLVAISATCKLTGLLTLPLAPLSVLRGPHPERRWMQALAVTVAVLFLWSALTPPSWFSGGPLYLGTMIEKRVSEFQTQTITQTFRADVLGIVPARYLWPIELILLLCATHLIERMLMARRFRVHSTWNVPGKTSIPH